MPAEKTTAIVLRRVDFSESSLVVTLYTRDFGKVQALAKGAKRPKGPFESALDLLTVCRIVFLRKSSDALDLLTEAKLLRRFRIPGRDLAALYAGYYVAELLGRLTHDYAPNPELFDLADETLAALSTGQRPGLWLLRFEIVLLRLLGHLPTLDRCADCGRVVPPHGRVAFGHLDGGVLCRACTGGKQQVAVVQAETIAAMRQLASDQSAWKQLDLERSVAGQLRGLLSTYICNLLGARPRMHQYLRLLKV